MYMWILCRKIFIVLMVLLVVSGCSANSNIKNETNNSIIVPTEDNQVYTKPSASVDVLENENTNGVFPQTKTLEQDFNQSEKATETKSVPAEGDKDQSDKIKIAFADNMPYIISFFEDESFEGQIKYDFNNDGKNEILEYSALNEKGSSNYNIIKKCRINIGEVTLEQKYQDDYYEEGIAELGIVDINKNDNFVEIFITEGYLRGGTAYIYRFQDNSFVEIGCVDGGIISTSGDGKVYYWGGSLYEDGGVNTDLVLSYYDIEKKEIVQTDQIVGKTIVSDRDIIVYKSSEDVIDGAPVTEEDKIRMSEGKIVKIIKPNEKYKVLSIENGVKISTEDDKIGWIGGFHMVWD